MWTARKSVGAWLGAMASFTMGGSQGADTKYSLVEILFYETAMVELSLCSGLGFSNEWLRPF